jgi:magnesium chelatase family protein
VTYPANIQLIAAMNPCRCGYLTDPGRACNQAPVCADRYQSRISGPLLDRIDLHIEMASQETAQMMEAPMGESSAVVAERVAVARRLQEARYRALGIRTNAELNDAAIREFATPGSDGMALLRQSTERLGLSMRAVHRVMKLARTIADMDESVAVHTHHVAEALSYRQMHYGRLMVA